MEPYRHILVALACADTDAALLEYAGMLARMVPGTAVRCVHVVPEKWAGDPNAAEAALKAAAAAHLRNPAGEVSCHVLRGVRVDRILHFAAEQTVDLVLLGHRRSRSGRRSLARRLAMNAPCSVCMVPEGSPAALRCILVPVDFSERAGDALAVAASLASRAGLRSCIALHVHFNSALITSGDYEEELSVEEQEAFWMFASRVDHHGVEITPVFEEGASVSQTVNRVAAEKGADLIVMGTRGRSRSAAILLGSETDQTIVETKIPILAVKHFGARMKLLQVLLDKRFHTEGEPRFS